MKVYYFNDENRPLNIKVQPMPTGEVPMQDVNIEYHLLEPQKGQMFEFTAPEGSIPYIKRWNQFILLITYLPAEAIQSLEKGSV
jgi:hypothetical protein